MCPVCAVTVAAGLGISRFLGIDDLVSSIWIGGLILSLSFITYDWLSKKWPKLHAIHYLLLTAFLMYTFALLPFVKNEFIAKILLGTFIGSVALLIGIWIDKKQRKIYKKQLLKFQKVVFPVISLIIASAIVYYLTK